MQLRFLVASLATVAAAATLPAIAQDRVVPTPVPTDLSAEPDDVTIAEPEFSPYLATGYPNQVFFGDTHLHTSYSTDAGMVGNRLDPDAALRFAKGQEVTSSTGTRARLIRPLDFLVVADHAENLGLATLLEQADAGLLATAWGKRVYNLYAAGDGWGAYEQWRFAMAERVDPLPDPEVAGSVWGRLVDIVDSHNQPGAFTAFHGFEWTSVVTGKNLHRVVIFRDGPEEAKSIIPLSQYDTLDPEELWEWLADYEAGTGGRALAIPHNGNLSNGLMFDVETLDGEALSADYAERRQRWEPLYEVTQTKGDGEAHPLLSPEDEFADYYTWDAGDFGLEAKTPEMLPGEYARSGLKRGLEFEASLGVNPFKFGMIGSTDSHTSLATTREENFFGKLPGAEPAVGEDRHTDKVTDDLREGGDGSTIIRAWESAASGLAAVWARENTREAIWDAMKRKETYATTGNRMLVRVFGGWDFSADEVSLPDFAKQGYVRGVPMGGDLPEAGEGAMAPTFLVRALRDPDGANLDRIQMVKGWLDENGESRERVYDIAWAGDRKPDADGKLPPIGSTVDVENATFTNDIGRAVLGAHWEDPDFDPSQRAFYYVRVLEIPTPSWLAYDRVRLGLEPPEGAVLEQQDRAYTSPIWYTPAG